MDTDTFLTLAQGVYQRTIVEEVLKQAGIEYEIRQTSAVRTVFGAHGAESLVGAEQFWVPAERLQEAKDLLCANGIVCEVSERLLRRSLDEIVKPLLGTKERDLDRLVRFVAINNKETVRALFEAALKETGGQELLEDLFFRLAAEPEDARDLRILARVLKDRVGKPFWERLLSEAVGGPKEVRLAVLDVLHELPVAPQRVEALVEALRDPDAEIRDAASEALYAIHGRDFGYDPEAPEGEREEAIESFLKALFPKWT